MDCDPLHSYWRPELFLLVKRLITWLLAFWFLMKVLEDAWKAVFVITGAHGINPAAVRAKPKETGTTEQWETRTLQRLHKQLERLDVLILDELGYVPFSKSGAELLFDVVSRAYERTSLIVTTNLLFEQWTEVLGSERLTGARLDRLTHRVHILEANGQSYRLTDAKRRLKRQ
jgi:hypothetical protein